MRITTQAPPTPMRMAPTEPVAAMPMVPCQPIAHGGAHHAQDQVTDQAAAAAHELAGDPADEGA